MTSWQTIAHRVSLAGRVTESTVGTPAGNGMKEPVVALSGALVTIVKAPQTFERRMSLHSGLKVTRRGERQARIDQAMTRKDGLFWFTDLPDGEYTLAAELPGSGSRFGKAQVTATVQGDKLAQANLVLSSTSLFGQVTGSPQKSALAMAEVRLKGCGEYSLTRADGTYTLRRIEAGRRTVVVTAQGYETTPQVITLAEPGDAQLQDFNLSRRRAEEQQQRTVEANRERGQTDDRP